MSETIQLRLIKNLTYAWTIITRIYIYIYICVYSMHAAYSWSENTSFENEIVKKSNEKHQIFIVWLLSLQPGYLVLLQTTPIN